MNQQFTAMILTLSLLLSLTGCSVTDAARALDRVENRMEEKLDDLEDSAENNARRAPTPAPDASTEAAFDPITKNEAEQIALDYLQLSRDQVSRLRAEYEIDNGICHYDVQFLSGDWEYEFKINAQNGKILSFDRDSRSD